MNSTRFMFLGSILAVAISLPATLRSGIFDSITKGLDDASKTLEKGRQIHDEAKPIVDDAKKIGKGLAGIGPEEEKTIGESVSMEIVNTYGGLVQDEAVTERVTLIGRTLARYSDRPNLEWTFGVLDSDDINGFSAPGGHVFITRGLFAMASDDDMLAGVLAHEIAHITEKHALGMVRRGEFFTGAKDIAVRRSDRVATVDSQVNQLNSQLQQFDLGITDIVKGICTTGFDSKTEYAADQKGRDLAALAGYARGGLRQALQDLKDKKPGDPAHLFSTHPPLNERIKRLADKTGK
jgi:predicted Zn-dependent protease